MRSGLRLALLNPATLPVTPLPAPPLSLLLLLKCILRFVFVIFIAWQYSLVASWCTLCVGMPKFSMSRPIVGCDDSCDLVSWFFS
jgi:hypothetical protein